MVFQTLGMMVTYYSKYMVICGYIPYESLINHFFSRGSSCEDLESSGGDSGSMYDMSGKGGSEGILTSKSLLSGNLMLVNINGYISKYQTSHLIM